MKLRQLIGGWILWFFRSWRKTARGKWHIAVREYPLRGEFVAACNPWGICIWKAIDAKNHMPPKGETMCKTCALLVKNRLY